MYAVLRPDIIKAHAKPVPPDTIARAVAAQQLVRPPILPAPVERCATVALQASRLIALVGGAVRAVEDIRIMRPKTTVPRAAALPVHIATILIVVRLARPLVLLVAEERHVILAPHQNLTIVPAVVLFPAVVAAAIPVVHLPPIVPRATALPVHIARAVAARLVQLAALVALRLAAVNVRRRQVTVASAILPLAAVIRVVTA